MANLITQVAKDQNVRYVLTLFDDMLQVRIYKGLVINNRKNIQEDKSRVELFHSAAARQKRTVWSQYLGILQRQDNFIVNQVFFGC